MARRTNYTRDNYGRFSSSPGGSGRTGAPKRTAGAKARAAASPAARRKKPTTVKNKGTLASRTSLKNSKAKLGFKRTSAQRGAVTRASNKLKKAKITNRSALTNKLSGIVAKRKGQKKRSKTSNKPSSKKVNIKAQRAKAMADRKGTVSGQKFVDGKAVKTMSLREMRSAVMSKVKGTGKSGMEYVMTAAGTRSKNRTPVTRSEWEKAYRNMISTPQSDRGRKTRPGVVNGIDIHKNFRPWAVFGLDPKTASKKDVNDAFKRVARKLHPDAGGRAKDFQRVKLMRDSVVALMDNAPSSNKTKKKPKQTKQKSSTSGLKLLPPGK